jgi:hypothetical protein
MYRYWKPGVEPPTFDDQPGEEAGGAPTAEAAADAGPQLSAAAQRVPAHLLERSRAALEKWKATHG